MNWQQLQLIFRVRWAGWRRIKNVIMVMDCIPGTIDTQKNLQPLKLSVEVQMAAEASLRSMWKLYAASEEDTISVEQLHEIVLACFGTGEVEASVVDFNDVRGRILGDAIDGRISFKQMKETMLGPVFRRLHSGRYTCVLSLAEVRRSKRTLY